MINNTQFGYIVDDSGKPIAKSVLSTGEHPLREGYTFIECENEDAMHSQFAAARASTTTVAEAQAKQKSHAINTIQGILDAKAQEYGYDHILSASSYVTSTFPKFKAEGTAFAKWRDDVWLYCYSVLAEWEAGTSKITTEDELIASLPEFKVEY